MKTKQWLKSPGDTVVQFEQKPLIFYNRKLLRSMWGVFLLMLLCVVCKDGPLIFFYVIAVAFLARIQPLTSHYVSLHVRVVL